MVKNYKTILAGLLVFVLCLSIGFTIKAEEEIIYQNPEEFLTVECTYRTMYNSSTDYTEYAYRDQMLLSHCGKEELSQDLAVASAALAMAAYLPENVEDSMEAMGYTVRERSNWYTRQTTYEDNDHVAYVIANKKVEYQGEVYNIYLLPVRGTPATSEWYSNFNVGQGNDHEGFYTAAEEVIEHLEKFIDPAYDAEHTIVWTMGHSRGAAVANVIAAKMTLEKPYVSAANVFGYTYACPNVSQRADVSLKNIYNFNNPGDPVTSIPLESWGFHRFGQTVLLPESDYVNFKRRYQDVTEKTYNVSMSTEGFAELMGSIAPTLEAYNRPDTQCLIDIVAYFLGGKDDTNSRHNALVFMLKHSKAKQSMYLSLAGLAGETMMASFKIGLDSYLLDEVRFLGEIDRAIDETDAYTEEEWLSWCNYQGSFLDKIKENLNVEVRNKEDLRRARNIQVGQIDDSSTLIGDIENVFYLFWDSNGDPASSFMQGHAQETYVWWLNSMYYGFMGWAGNQNITQVTVDNGVTYVGSLCFNDTSVENIVFGDLVERVGNGVCSSCTKLKEVVMLGAVQYAGEAAFAYCGDLEKMTLPVDMEYIREFGYDDTFYETTGIKEVNYTVGMTGEMLDRSEGRFSLEKYSGQSIEKVTYQNGITKIGSHANEGCSNLKIVNIPESIREIGVGAFSDCSQLVIPQLPKNLEKVGEYCFAGTRTKSIEFGEKIESIPDRVCAGCTDLTEVKISNTTKIIGAAAFANCIALEKIILPVDTDYRRDFSYNATFYETSGIKEIIYTVGTTGKMSDRNDGRYSVEYCSSRSLEKITYQDGITRIGAYANYECSNLKIANLPESVKEVGDYGFYGCTQLQMTELPKGLERVGAYGFANSGLSCEYVNIPYVGEGSFSGSRIKSIEFGETIEVLPDGVCNGCAALTDVKISNMAKTAGKAAFAHCDALEKIMLPVDMEYTQEFSYGDTFYETKGIKEITYTAGTTGKMSDRPLYGNSMESYSKRSIEKVIYQDGITKIGNYVNANCENLKAAQLPESLVEISETAFDFCANEFTIYGFRDTEAETYAAQKIYKFIPLYYPVISPEITTMDRGSQKQFTALVYTGIDETTDVVEWSISGNQSKKTQIDENGLLVVGKDEKAEMIEIFATIEDGIASMPISLEGEITELKVSVTEVFADISEGQWYTSSIQYVYDHGLMSGSNGVFNPTVNITRAQVVATLYKLEGSPVATDFKAVEELVDVEAGQWYTNAICWAYNTGVASGNQTTKMFNVNNPVTRQQLASFFYSYAKYKGLDTETRGDISAMAGAEQVADYALETMQWAVGTGLITGSKTTVNGVEVSDLKPTGTATRAQVAAMIQRFCEGNQI